uniref:Putative regulatory protein n=1 Tax=termite gut metagenome TaxID=433724 RepID=S0DGQ0_9ZZZZ
MKKHTDNALKRAEELIRAMIDNDLDDELHGQIREWFLSVGEDGPAEEALARWAVQNIKAKSTLPGNAERMGFKRLAARLGFVRAESSRPMRPALPLRHIALRVAAVLLPVILVAGGALLLYNDGFFDRTPVEVQNTVLAVDMESEHQTYTLPDGSKVTVASGSELAYSSEEFAVKRDIWLDGEAFFVVAHDTEHPFTVHHDGMKVTVLGTEFSVKAHAEHGTAEVVLTRGSVVVQHGENRVEMTPGKKATIDKASHTIELTEAGAGEIMRVLGEELTIESMPALEAVRIAADYFRKTLVIEPGTPSGDSISVILPQRVPLEAVLTYINRISDSVECRISGDAIVVSRK